MYQQGLIKTVGATADFAPRQAACNSCCHRRCAANASKLCALQHGLSKPLCCVGSRLLLVLPSPVRCPLSTLCWCWGATSSTAAACSTAHGRASVKQSATCWVRAAAAAGGVSAARQWCYMSQCSQPHSHAFSRRLSSCVQHENPQHNPQHNMHLVGSRK